MTKPKGSHFRAGRRRLPTTDQPAEIVDAASSNSEGSKDSRDTHTGDRGTVPQRYEAAVAIDSITEHPDNPNNGNDAAVTESIESNGFWGAIGVQVSSNRICYGHTRWRARKSLGHTTIPVMWLDVSDEQALRIVLADNATAELAERDATAVARVIAKLPSGPSMLRGTGYAMHPLRHQLVSIVASLPSVSGVGLAGEDDVTDDDSDVQPDAMGTCDECEHGIEPVPLWAVGGRMLCEECGVDAQAALDGVGDDSDPAPGHGWDGQMEAATDDTDTPEQAEPSAMADDEPEAKRASSADDRYPLAIVLDQRQMRLWKDFKQKVDIKRDKPAFVAMLDATMNVGVGSRDDS